jgi:methyltransferase, FkbM family
MPHVPPRTGPLAQRLKELEPQRLVAPVPSGVVVILVDVDRQSLAQTLYTLLKDQPGIAIAGYHLTGETAPPEPLCMASRPPIPHISLEDALRHPEAVLAVGIWIPDKTIAAIHGRTRRYLIVPAPNRYAPFVYERVPDFYETRHEKLEAVYGSLRGEESKTSFARVIKARITGESAYIAPTGDMYAHAPTDAAPGDIVIDGGVFRFEDELRQFSLSVGSEGKIYSFEPDRKNFLTIQEAMRNHLPANITLCNLGLFSEKSRLGIVEAQSASALAGTSIAGVPVTGTALCDVTDLDSFVAENAVPRVDLLKLDIEGAEIEALVGAEKTIRTHKPKLKISAYHTVDHVWEIPVLLRSFVPEYVFEFHTPAPYLVEYILFAYAPGDENHANT